MQKRNIYLIGFMGAGKSTVTRELAHELQREWVDTDELVEKEVGLSIPKIFERYGEERFREIEARVIEDLSQMRGMVVAVGGGAPLRKTNWRRLRSTGEIMYLKVSPAEVMKRIGNDVSRPLLAGLTRERKREKVEQMLQERHPCYSKAGHIVPCDGIETAHIVREIIARVNATGTDD